MKPAVKHQPWKVEPLDTIEQVFDVLGMLRGKGWLCRGLPKAYGALRTSFDWRTPQNLSRREKLRIERQSINIFRSTVRFFTTGEEAATQDDLIALMVLRSEERRVG